MSTPAITVPARRIEAPERRTRSKVRHSSRPAGTIRGVSLSWREANERIQAIRKWERRQVKAERAKNRAVGHIGIALYEFLCRRAVNKAGRLDDLSYEALAAILGFARSAIVAAAKRLKRFGWLNWRRQFRPSSNPALRGPPVEQDVNAFWVEAPIAALIKLGIRFGPAPPPDDHDAARRAGEAENKAADFAESKLGGALDVLSAAIRRKRETS